MSAIRSYMIEPARRTDGPAIRRICIATCWMGSYRPETLLDEEIWADYWTRWFIERERHLSWVVRRLRDGQVVGYLTGTADERRFHRYVPWLVPGFALQVLRRRLDGRPVDRAGLKAAVRYMIRGETDVPARLMAAYPATWHVDLLPEARGRGLGSELLERFLAKLRERRVSGLHAQPMSINPAIIALLKRAGFQLAQARKLTAFEHVVREPIEVQTWVRRV